MENDGRSAIIHIATEAKSAGKAARITQAIAEEYIKVQGELKNHAIEMTKGRLDQRLEDLRQSAFEAEESAENFRRKSGLITLGAPLDSSDETPGATYTSRLLSEFSRQAADLSAQAAQAQTRASAAAADIARTGGRRTPEVLASPVVSSLIEQEATLAKTEASLASRYTSEHPLLMEARKERQAINYALSQTVNNIQGAIRLQQQAAKAAENMANSKAAALTGQVSKEMADSVRYRQLRDEARLKRMTYENFAKDAAVIAERAVLQLPDVQLVSPASIPLKESFPKRPLIFAAGALLSILLAFAIALGRAFRNLRQP